MSNSQDQGRRKQLILTVVSIFGVIGTSIGIGSFILGTINKPMLTYEHSSHPLPAEESMISIVVRNEGRASAEQVEIKVKVNGEIRNASVLQRDIAGEMPEFELFGESVSIETKDSSGIIAIPCITKGAKYVLDLIVKPRGDKAIQTLIVASKNGGPAKEYVEKSGLVLTSVLRGFGAGVGLTLASVFLFKRFRRHRAQKGHDTALRTPKEGEGAIG